MTPAACAWRVAASVFPLFLPRAHRDDLTPSDLTQEAPKGERQQLAVWQQGLPENPSCLSALVSGAKLSALQQRDTLGKGSQGIEGCCGA